MRDDIIINEPKIPWYRRHLFWTLKERIAYDLIAVAILVSALYLLFHFVFGFAIVDGNSMYPTLKNNQVVFYNRLEDTYQKGDIVSVRMPSGEFYVKRIVAVAGDTVKETYAFGSTTAEEGNVEYPLIVGNGKYFILGDNRENSNDSRAFGAVIKERITGKVLFEFGTVK